MAGSRRLHSRAQGRSPDDADLRRGAAEYLAEARRTRFVAYTLGGAFASFEEQDKGQIKPGMLADLVLIDKDLRAIPPAEIRAARVVRTIVGGTTVFSR